MNTFNFTKWNKILGWVVFAIALLTYSLTVEPTSSFWDAGEYIATSSKLQVGHPPGAPLFQMIGAFASIFASDPTQIALVVNMTSAVASAFAILFMFWSITILLRKLILSSEEEFSQSKGIAVLGAALVGSLSFTFTDSFWFNAVEAEVYAMATCILSILFYLGLLWERDMHKPRGNRWLILISLIVGLSFGVHFMGLLSIPAIGLLYYFKNYKVTLKSFITANIIVVAVLLFIFKLLLPSTLKFFGALEVFFVNSINLPFNSGTIIAALLISTAFYFGLKFTRKKEYAQLNTLLLCILFILVGFSSWIMLPIRANAGTVINENNPNNARELLAYYNLEQYPETHLFYGPQFSEIYAGLDEDEPYKEGKPKYEKDTKKGKYIIVNKNYKKSRQNLDNRHKAFLPRMWSTEHISNYMEYTGPLKFTIKPEYQGKKELIDVITEFRRDYARGNIDYDDYHKFLQSFGEYINVQKPTLLSNIHYLIDYQMGYMYWRYFMWNFVGRQNDVQGKMTNLDGNWLSGIKFIDETRLGSQENLPSDALKNKARNTYYFLPLILGLLGLIFQAQKDKKNFWILLVFFLFTGLALKIYLNERPFEPRERDYALVGSFYVFAMWIGFGVYALFDLLKEAISPKLSAPITTVICLLAVPTLLASENWDDHDRSNRYTAQSMAKMYLQSCQKDAIIFTIGDNDTFALWYAQEIEGYRTDVRTVNTSLFATDWYIDQMKRAAYDSKPIPSQLDHKFYAHGNNDAIFHQEITKDTMLIKNWMRWIQSDDPRTQGDLASGVTVNTFPTKHIRIPVDKEAVLKNGIVAPEDADQIVPYIDIHLKGEVLYKNRLMMLDIIANNNWERPIYFTGGSFGDDDYLWMKDYLQLDGLTYKLVPIKTKVDPRLPFEMGRIHTKTMYNNVKSWEWGNSESPDIYHDPETRKNSITYRSNLARLVEALIQEGDMKKAKEILDLGMEKLPIEYYEYYTLLEPYVSGYYKVGEKEKARALWVKIAKKYQEQLTYFSNLTLLEQHNYGEEILINVERYRAVVDLLIENQDKDWIEEKAEEFNSYLRMFSKLYKGDRSYDEEEAIRKQEEDLKKEFKKESDIQDSIDSIPNAQ